MIDIPERVKERVMSRWTDVDGCWISSYSVGSHGYAQVGWQVGERKSVTVAHRVAWVAANGTDIPDGMTVDHTCFTRRCINPEHLRLLSRSANSGIHQGPWIPRARSRPRTSPPAGRKCKQGHELVLTKSGVAYCNDCRALSRELRRLALVTTQGAT